MQDWQKEILEHNIQRRMNIEKSVQENISAKEEKQDISKAHDLELINDAICKGECDYLLEKGNKANVGEERAWGNNRYRKLPNGKWELVSQKGKEYKEPKDKEEQKKENSFKVGERVSWDSELEIKHGVITGEKDDKGRYKIKFDDSSKAWIYPDAINKESKKEKATV